MSSANIRKRSTSARRPDSPVKEHGDAIVRDSHPLPLYKPKQTCKDQSSDYYADAGRSQRLEHECQEANIHFPEHLLIA